MLLSLSTSQGSALQKQAPVQAQGPPLAVDSFSKDQVFTEPSSLA